MVFNDLPLVAAVTVSTEQLVHNAYLRSLVILVSFFLIARLVYWIAKKYLIKVAQKTATELDDLVLKKAEIPVAALIFLFGVKIAVIPLSLVDPWAGIIQHSVSTVVILFITYIIVILLDMLVAHWAKQYSERTRTKLDDQILIFGGRTVRIIGFIVALLFILQVWGVKIGPLLASLGIVGVAVAFGLQNTLGNVFGGVSLIADRSIRVGDIIKLDEETGGEVMDVGLRATKIKSWNNELIIVPNGTLANTRIKNYVLPNRKARIEVPFSVAYGSSVDKVKKVVLEQVHKLKNLDDKNPSRVVFIEMGPSSINFKALVWLNSYEIRFDTKEQLNCWIYDALQKNGISIPFPQMDVHVDLKKRKK